MTTSCERETSRISILNSIGSRERLRSVNGASSSSHHLPTKIVPKKRWHSVDALDSDVRFLTRSRFWDA